MQVNTFHEIPNVYPLKFIPNKDIILIYLFYNDLIYEGFQRFFINLLEIAPEKMLPTVL